MTGQVLNRREEHKRHTRAALEKAALDLFVREGFEHTSVEEIAVEAGVSVRTFFRYFHSKRHVLFGDVAFQRVTQLVRLLERRPASEEPLESVRIVLESADVNDPDELDQIRARMRLMIGEASLVPVYLAINRELQREVALFVARRKGLPPTHPYPLLVSAAAAGSWDAALHAWATGQADDLTMLRRRMFSQLTTGLTES